MHRLDAQQQKSVPLEVYTRDLAERDRRIAELQRDLETERHDRREAVRQLDIELEAERQARHTGDKELREKSSTSWRQVIFQGVLPILVALATIAVSVALATRGAK